MRVCKHVGDLVQKAGDNMDRDTTKVAPNVSLRTLKHGSSVQEMVPSVFVLLVDDNLRLVVVDQEAVKQRDEHLSRVRHHHHLRLRQCALHVVEVKDLVVGDEANLNGRVLRTVLSKGGDSSVRRDAFVPLEVNIYTNRPFCFS